MADKNTDITPEERTRLRAEFDKSEEMAKQMPALPEVTKEVASGPRMYVSVLLKDSALPDDLDMDDGDDRWEAYLFPRKKVKSSLSSVEGEGLIFVL